MGKRRMVKTCERKGKMKGERLKEGRGKEKKNIKKSNRNGKKDELLHGDKKKEIRTVHTT